MIGDTQELSSEVFADRETALYYILPNGTHLGYFNYVPSDDAIQVPNPAAVDQVWDFGARIWGSSRMLLAQIEDVWREEQIVIINRQLEALEEAEADVPPDDLLPGSRTQWLSYRGKVRAWKEGHPEFPDLAKRPTRPS